MAVNPETEIMPPNMGGEGLVAQGNTLMRTQTPFTTAVSIAKPRIRAAVVRACEEEAAIAGDEFYYSWTVKDKKGGSQLVEGLSVQAALAAARNWGNCAVPCSVDEVGVAYIFTATFLDMETGFNLQRILRQRKNPNIGMKDADRAEDITFQIGQSKALRNVILNALPSWLTSKMLAKAKENVVEKIKKMGVDVARKKTIEFFGKYSVTVERIEKKVGKKADRWDPEDLATLQGAINALLNGQESAESLFPENETAPASKSDTVKPATTPGQTEKKEEAPKESAQEPEKKAEEPLKTGEKGTKGAAKDSKPDNCLLEPKTCEYSAFVDGAAQCTHPSNKGICGPGKGKKY